MTSTNEKKDVKEQSTSSQSQDDEPREDVFRLTVDIPTAGVHESAEPIEAVFSITGDNGRLQRVDFNDNPSWLFETQWDCHTEPEKCYLQMSENFYDHVCTLKCANVNLVTLDISSLKLIFGHETRGYAFKKVRTFTVVNHTIEKFLKEIDSKVKFIKTDVKVQPRRPIDGAATERKKVTGSQLEEKHKEVPHFGAVASKSSISRSITGLQGSPKVTHSNITGLHKGNTYNNCMFVTASEWSITGMLKRVVSKLFQLRIKDFTFFKDEMEECYDATLQEITQGCLIFHFAHKSRGDALKMIIKHKQVKEQILHFLRNFDAELTDIWMQVKLCQPSGHKLVQMELANLKKRYTAMKRGVDSIKGQIDALENDDWQRQINFLFEEMDALRLFSVKLKRLMTELDRKKKALRHPPVDDLSPVCDGRDLLAFRINPQLMEFKQRIMGQEDVLCSIKEFLVGDKILIDYLQTKIDSLIMNRRRRNRDHWIMKRRRRNRDEYGLEYDEHIDDSAAINLERELERVTQQLQVNMEINSERDSGDKERDETKTGEMGQLSIKFQDMMKRDEDVDDSDSSHFDEPSISKETLRDDYTASQERDMRAAETQICIAEIAEQEKMLLTLEEEKDLQKRHLDSLYCDLPHEWFIKVHYLQRHQDVLSLYDVELPEVISEMVRPGPSHIQTAKLDISPEDKIHQRPVKRSQIAKLRRFQQGLLKESDLFDIIGNMIVDDEDHLASLQALNGPVYVVGPSSLQVVCPKLHLDAARANTKFCHVTTDGELVNSDTRSRDRRRLQKYSGTCASTPIPLSPPHPALTPVYNTPRYWETRTGVGEVELGWPYVLEMGLVEAGQVDSELCVSLQRHRSWCVRVESCVRHRESICTRVWREGEQGECHQNTMSRTPGTQATFHYGVVLDVGRGRVAFIDLNRGIVLAKFDESFGEDLYPVFGVPPSDDSVNMELISGDNIAITDTKMSLIHDALT